MEREYHLIFKVLLLGDTNVGKSSFVMRTIHNKFSNDFNPTIGVDFCSKVFRYNNMNIKLQIWDTAGQERFKSIVRAFYKGGDLAIMCFDIGCSQSFKNMNTWLNDLKVECNDQIAVILLGMKSDLADKRQVTTHEAQVFAGEIGAKYIEISCKEQNAEQIEREFLPFVFEGLLNKKNKINIYESSLDLSFPKSRDRVCGCCF